MQVLIIQKTKKEVLIEDDRPTGNEDLKTMTIEELNNILNEVLDTEDYIRAIAIRDEINSRNKKKSRMN